MTNVLHVTDFYNRANTGITNAIRHLICQTRTHGPRGSTLGLVTAGQIDVDVPPGTLLKAIELSRNPLMRAWNFAPQFSQAVRKIIRVNSISVVHIHGTWLHQQFAAVRVAEEQGVPVILTNHGHLEAWALSQPGRLGALKKQIYLKLMDGPMFRKVDVFHAISPLNRDMLHKLFPGAHVELIPNSIDVTSTDEILAGYRRSSAVAPYVLFVGRLAPQKGVDILIQAFGQAELPPGWKLVLVGPAATEEYHTYLRQLIDKSARKDAIELREGIWDPAEKLRLMADAWLVAVPSRSDVVALVNLEASACRTPTVTTSRTGLLDWTEGGGLLIEPCVEALMRSLTAVTAWSDSERAARGEASRRLVETRYSTEFTGPRWVELYNSLVRRRSR